MKRVVITGGTGFVGANLARHALHAGHDVHLLVRPEHDAWRVADVQADMRLHNAPLHDRDAVHRAIRAIRPDCVFHLAAHGAYSWQTDVASIVRTNFLGTMHLVEACADAGCEVLVNTGSSSEYGYKDHAPAETELPEPNSHYAVAKAAATMFCRFTANARGMRIPTLRLYSVYGPYEDPFRLIPTLILRALASELPPLANPDTARDYVYIADVLDAYWRAATAQLPEPGVVYNVGTGVQTSLRDIVHMVGELLDVRAEPEWGSMPSRAWDTTVWRADPSRIKTELRWSPLHDLRAGLRETIKWFARDSAMQEIYRGRMQRRPS